MSSANKSEFLGLNIWAGTDIPKRADFNFDNTVIDEAMKQHCENTDVHITSEDRQAWGQMYFSGVYYGNSASSRTIETNCPFEPSFGIVFANTTAPSVSNFSGGMSYNYFALVSKRANTLGAALSGKNLVVKQSATAVVSNEYAALNATGYTYCYILFR